MPRLRVGMRWWLAAVFGLIAALTAVLVATVSSRQAAADVRANAEDIAVGKTVAAGFSVQQAVRNGNLQEAVTLISTRQRLTVFVFSPQGAVLASTASKRWQAVPDRQAALRSALDGHRFVESFADGGETLVALPLRRTDAAAALVAYAPQATAYGRSLAIFHREVVRAALWAMLAAVAVGLLAAVLVVRRLQRIAVAAAAIEQGDFDLRLTPRLHDEVGSLALTIDRMRGRLRESFERLRAERDQLGLLLEQLQEGVVAVDATLDVQFANASATALVGPGVVRGATLPESWRGLPLRELATGLFRPDAALAEARTGGEDGPAVALVGVPATAAGLAVLVLTDITDRERRERAEREFVANAAHELRTPVAAIASAVEALESGAQDSPADREAFVALIGRQARRLARLSRSLLIMARAQTREQPVQLERIELRPLLDEVVASSEPPAGGSVQVACAGDVVALAQRELLEQVVSNLVGNAVKHAGDGERAVVVAGRAEGATVVIEVNDSGPGIPAEVADRIFDRFYSGHDGRRDGFGLGLAIARDAVRTLGGSIEIGSRPDRGTSARVTLPGWQA